ncbi:MAG: aminotransferase class I/II-fold pyridoxal phosphate-dependent enzyme [Verrucomicrobia bacterium]|nr:aminotransferase class I/II-fold pyridoxal phosphate-dependent enzyme [Verrucomicrobiota bacterium]
MGHGWLYETRVIEPPLLQQIDRTYVLYRGHKYSYFSGCDYYRLSTHPEVLRALNAGVQRFGLTVAASRLTTGNHPLYGELERRLTSFFKAPTATVFSSGYVANLGVAQALAGGFDCALMDERAHASLADAASWLACPVVRFQHRDAQDVARIVRNGARASRFILLTDGLFSHDGSVAPLKELLEVLPRNSVVWVDDAHAAGVLGREGKGTLEHAGVSRSRIIQTITLGKAFGVYGGAVLGSASLRRRILSQSSLFVGNTPMPLPLVAAAIQALSTFQKDRSLLTRLFANTKYVKDQLREIGAAIPDTPGPIVSVAPRDRRAIEALKKHLLAARIYPPFIRYPGGPADGHFRFALSSEHTRLQLDTLIEVISK